MKDYNYTDIPKALLTPDIVAALTSIHEHKGKQGLYIEAHADVLTAHKSLVFTCTPQDNSDTLATYML